MEPDAPPSSAIRHVELKAALLIGLAVVLVAGFVAYVFYARGVFEPTQRLVLMAEDSEGVIVGANLTFSGFPIGRVQRIELAPNGKARIEIDVPRKDAKWLRATSVFTLERGLVGPARLRAFTGDLEAAPLEDGAVRQVLRGDATDELPLLIANMKQVLTNLERMTGAESSLSASLDNVRTVTGRMTGRYGALAGVLGGEAHAKQVVDAIERTNRLLASLSGLPLRLERTLSGAERTLGSAERLIAKADQQAFGPGGMADETKRALAQLNATLTQAREGLRKADAVLADAQKISANTRAATEDLAALRAEVEASLRKLAALIDEINRKWPFERDTEIRLP
jgi:phospholipid/cholesterol/gamma-HCH transport system substrate-binding protein